MELSQFLFFFWEKIYRRYTRFVAKMTSSFFFFFFFFFIISPGHPEMGTIIEGVISCKRADKVKGKCAI